MVQNEAINIIKAYIKALNQGGLMINKAFLYGSFARNEANENSDIDVMLISDDFDTDDDYILSKPWSPAFRFDYRIEPISIGTKQFMTDDVSPIIEIVRREGIEIH